jgi:hypothetical protein
MDKRLTGLGVWGAQWDYTPGDKEATVRVLTFLEDRRVLFGLRHMEDEQHCLQSVFEIRHMLTDVLGTATTGRDLTQSLRIMRAACRTFIEAAGVDAMNFRDRRNYGLDPFSGALGELRAMFGLQVGMLAAQYKIQIEDDLVSIIVSPLDDPEFIPGFGPPNTA